MNRTKRPFTELLILRASYDQKLHEAILNGDESYVKSYVETYARDDAAIYDKNEVINMEQLQVQLLASDKEYERAFTAGRPIMGM